MNVDRKSLWIRCPACQGKTRIKIYKSTVLVNFPLFCPKCRKEAVINVANLKMTVNSEPDD